MYIVCPPQIKPCIIKGGIVQQHNERDITSAKSSSASTIFDVDKHFLVFRFGLLGFACDACFLIFHIEFAGSFLFTTYKQPEGHQTGWGEI